MKAVTSSLIAVVVLCALAVFGCGPTTPDPDAVTAAWSLTPGPPRAGEPTQVLITLRDANGQPIKGAKLTVDAHMDHPGMAPVTAEAFESQTGVYQAPLTFSMDGDWTLVAEGTLQDGTRISRSLDVSNVQ
jgi:hypothetical protein